MAGPPAPVQLPVNTFATLSLVFGFVFAPLGAVFGHLGLAQIKRTGERGRDRALIGLVVSYLLIVVSIVAVLIWAVVPGASVTADGQSISSTSRSRPPASTSSAAPVLVTRPQLPGLLLNLDEIKQALPTLDDTYTATDRSGELNGSPGVTTTPETCRVAMFAGAAEVYGSATATFARTVVTSDAGATLQLGGVEQWAILYRDAGAAQAQVRKIEKMWSECVGPVAETVDHGRRTVHFQVDPLTRAPRDGSIVMLHSAIVDGENELQGTRNIRAIAAKANVVVDLAVFGGNPGDSAEVIAADILARIPG